MHKPVEMKDTPLGKMALKLYESNKEEWLENVRKMKNEQEHCKSKFIILPILIDGGFDTLRYNVQEDKFDKFTFTMEGAENHYCNYIDMWL